MHRAARRRAARRPGGATGPTARGRGQQQIHRERRRRPDGRSAAGRCADRVLAAGEAGIRRPAGGPPPASAPRPSSTRCRAASCTATTSTTISCSCARRWPPTTWTAACRPTGSITRWPTACRKPDPHGGRLRAGAAVRGPAARHAPAGPRRRQATARATAAPRRPAHRQRLPDPCAGLAVLPQQGRLHRRPADQPDHRLPLRRGARATRPDR